MEYFTKSRKQEVDVRQTWKHIQRYGTTYWNCISNIKAFKYIAAEKTVTKNSVMEYFTKSRKQEVDVWQTWKRIPRYGTTYWSCIPNIKAFRYIAAEKTVTENSVTDDYDDARREKWSLYVAPHFVCRRHKNHVTCADLLSKYLFTWAQDFVDQTIVNVFSWAQFFMDYR